MRLEPATEPASSVGLRPYSQVFAPFLCGMFAFIDLYCTQPLLPLLSRVFHASEAKVSWTISASTLGAKLDACSGYSGSCDCTALVCSLRFRFERVIATPEDQDPRDDRENRK